jgi:hypothetical protein
MALSCAVAIGVLASSVYRRSWSFWLLGFALLVVAAIVAWYFRAPGHDATAAREPGTLVAAGQVAPSARMSRGAVA